MKILFILFIFAISGQGVSHADQSEKALAEKILRDVETLYSMALDMMVLRNSGNLSECITMMHKNQEIFKKLRTQAKNLSNDFIGVKVAAAETEMCVTCAPWAMDHCANAGEFIEGAQQEVE